MAGYHQVGAGEVVVAVADAVTGADADAAVVFMKVCRGWGAVALPAHRQSL